MKNPLLKPHVLDYSKVEQKLKKAIPEITQEEINEIISTIPPTMPMVLVSSMIQVLKVTYKNPKELERLKKTNAVDEINKLK